MNLPSLARVLQLASQALPIGGYSHSQGLESAVEHGVVADEATALRWVAQVLEFSMKTYELPMLLAMHAAWGSVAADGGLPLADLNEEFLASRESAELRAATVQMGYSMRALLRVLGDVPPQVLEVLDSMDEPALPCVWSAAAAVWHVAPTVSAMAYAWSWAENQVLAALKTVPLGQSAGQRILLALGKRIAQVLADELPEERARSNFTPALSILCSRHETQYSRLFRS